jgi:hypothetical protein
MQIVSLLPDGAIAWSKTFDGHVRGLCLDAVGTGQSIDRDQDVAVGVEAFLDKKRRRFVLCTVFKLGE